jgi:hypothetical protein
MKKRAKPKKPTLDTELVRIQGILGVIDELADRTWKLKRDCGDDAYKRAMAYINSRKGWVFHRFQPPVQ